MDHVDAFPESQMANTSHVDAAPVQEENLLTPHSQATEQSQEIQRIQANDDDYYDMSKRKYMHIFNHFKFRQTREFGNKKPTDRVGTHNDVKILEETFRALGFELKIHQDLTHNKIMKVVEKLINQDHNNTSCVALVILTHGSHDGYLFAEDQPYELKEVTKMLEHQKLVLIPKLLFLQVSMVAENLPHQFTVDKVIHRMNSWRSSIKRFRRSINPQIFKFWTKYQSPPSTSTTSDAAMKAAPINETACRGHTLDKGHQVEVDGIIRNLVHVPTHIDFFILHSAADGHASFRCSEEGSWMIQSLCKVIKKYHMTHDILQMITLVNRRVAYDYTAFNSQYTTYNNKKQSLEARFTLTKFLKL